MLSSSSEEHFLHMYSSFGLPVCEILWIPSKKIRIPIWCHLSFSPYPSFNIFFLQLCIFYVDTCCISPVSIHAWGKKSWHRKNNHIIKNQWRKWVRFRSILLSSQRYWTLSHRYHRHQRRLPNEDVTSSRPTAVGMPPYPCPCFFPRPRQSLGPPIMNLIVASSPLDRHITLTRKMIQLMPNWCFSFHILHPDCDWNKGGQLRLRRHHLHLVKTKNAFYKSLTIPWSWWYPRYPRWRKRFPITTRITCRSH